MPDQLKIKTLRALFWSCLERAGQQGIQFVVMIILARLLLPEDFGLIAMLAIFMAIAQSFMDSGFGQALIQKQDTTHVEECSIFYFNILVGGLAAALLCLAAPWIASFYDQPLLTPLTRALSLNLVINSFGVIQISVLTKRIDFKTQMKVGVIAAILSGTIGVSMAFGGFGIWSLIALSLSSSLFRTLLLWFFNTWRPSLIFSVGALREMFGFSSRLLASGLIGAIFDNIYLIVIGKMFPAAELGFYSRAKGFQRLPVDNISDAAGRVAFPVFSSVQDDKARLKRGVHKALTTLAMVNFPMMIGLAVVAKPLVVLLLTEKWLPCVPYLQLLCVAGMLRPLVIVNLNVLKAQGRSDLNLRITLFKNILKAAVLAITWSWGIEVILLGQVAVSLVCYLVNTHYTGILINYSAREQIRDFSPYLGVAGIMGVCVYTLQYVLPANLVVLLTLQVLAGATLFTVLVTALRLPAFMEIWETHASIVFPYAQASLPYRVSRRIQGFILRRNE